MPTVGGWPGDWRRAVRADHSGAAALKATLASRNNHDRFAAVATGNPQFGAALPISAGIAALAEIGLHAGDESATFFRNARLRSLFASLCFRGRWNRALSPLIADMVTQA